MTSKDELTKSAYKEVESLLKNEMEALRQYMKETFVPRPQFILVSSILFFMSALALGIRVAEIFKLFPAGVLAGCN